MDSLPLAVPYPWTVSENQASRILTRKRKGSGLSYLQTKSMSQGAKLILEDLLGSSDPETQDTSHFQTSTFYSAPHIPDVPGEDDDDATIVSLAQDGYLSLLLQIIKQVDQGVLTVKALIRGCALAVNPIATPGSLDAKEMVLAALHFLSSSANLSGADGSTVSLPLLDADDSQEDQEKRIYRKVGDWMWTDYKTVAFSELQLVFDSSPIRREAFVPRFLSDQDEIPLLQKGVIPSSAAPRRKGPAPGYRRKSNQSPGLG